MHFTRYSRTNLSHWDQHTWTTMNLKNRQTWDLWFNRFYSLLLKSLIWGFKKAFFSTHFICCCFHCPKIRIPHHCWPWVSVEQKKTQSHGKKGPFLVINTRMHIWRNGVHSLTDKILAFTGCKQNIYNQRSLQSQNSLNLAVKKSLLWHVTNRMHPNIYSQGIRTLPGLQGPYFAMRRMLSAMQTFSSVKFVQLVKRKW